jgi:uncharacterized protein YqjF (DUF2071 family)
MLQAWRQLSFIHWSYDPAEIRPLVPSELEVDTFDGAAWVGLTPFLLTLRPPFLPPLPGLAPAPETNVRTYVRDRHGRRGILFFSLDLTVLWAVVGARATFQLPYMWSEMTVRPGSQRIDYSGRRRLPRGGASYALAVAPGRQRPVNELENFLTARWRLYTKIAGRLCEVRVEHERWPLAPARLLHLEEDLLQSVGIPAPRSNALAHFSPGVSVRVGFPQPV